ncbi:MAG: SpoIIE family protein phosphatase [Deltaproteobacteria bacterium]|nr:SpoIIE family protein phosphatase [Deltaproteobacteria bacterium]
MGSREWAGGKAGLRFLDRIVAVDGQPIYNGRDLIALLKDKQPGTPVEYTVESKGNVRRVIVPVDIFRLKDFLLVFFITFSVGFVLYVLGVVVYVLKPNTSASWVFFAPCFCLGTYMVTGFEAMSSYYLVHIHYLIYPFYAPTFVHLALIFPERKQFLNRFPKLEYLVYLPALILEPAYQAYLFTYEKALSANLFSWIPNMKQIGTVNRYYVLFCAASMIGLVFHSMYWALSSSARQRAKMIFFGATIAFLPAAIIMLIVMTMKVNFPWNYLPFFIIFFPSSIAFSIVKHNLFDADEIIKRTVGYVVVTAVVIGAYAVVSVTLNVFLEQYQVAQSKAFPILFTLGVILVFNPLRNRIQALVDRVFFRKEYDYGEIIDKISGAITSLLDLGQVLHRLTSTFIEDMFINTSSVMLLDPATSEYRVYLADGDNSAEVEKVVFRRSDKLMQIVEGEKRELTKNDVLEDPKFKAISEACAANFDSLHASLMVPLIYQGEVTGLLNIGEKKSGKFYNRQDIDLLRTLANQGAVAIENARLFQENLEKQRMEEELNIARDLQTSMLPSECPEIQGFEIAAYSVSAREVGGDFYDFIEMGEDKVGMVIGDVTGKSVSGALVMSASRSVFRMLSEEEMGVGEIMIRANRRTKKDIKSGMFVALLYAVLNTNDKTLSLCSAGQTQPVHLSAESGKAILVETKGDTFPLGILEDVEYQETRLELAPGDMIVLYTDGIVEAMNEQEEMYGFDRLLEVVQGAKSMTAESLLKKILYEVNAFVGGVAQHDDITIIVINAEE